MDRSTARIDHARMLSRLRELGEVGREVGGGRTRLALTQADQQGRNLVRLWLEKGGHRVVVDRIGNIYGLLAGRVPGAPVMIGSHIDTVVSAGAYDGCYGVLAGIEILDALRRAGERPLYPVVVTAFTNEEGARFGPDLLGSRVMAGDLALDVALAIPVDEESSVAQELQRIGYAGDMSPQELLPRAYLELHIEQGPVLDAEHVQIGVVEGIQGHAWWRVAVRGLANHAGTVPMHMRRDAGASAFRLAAQLIAAASDRGEPRVATVGTMSLEPNAVNVVPGSATFTVDFRDYRQEALAGAERKLQQHLRQLEAEGFTTQSERISEGAPMILDPGMCALLEETSARLGVRSLRMSSGASHDAQMLARVCPTGMIFVPSKDGVSHNPQEHTEEADLARGADVLLEAVSRLARGEAGPRSA